MSARHDLAVQTPPAELRAFVEREVTAGRTISLAATDLDAATLRAALPGILEDLAAAGRLPASAVAIPGYTVLGEIGVGGSSTVYLARHEALQRHVALKVAHRPPGDPGARDLPLREARAMARLRHPNVLSIHDVIDANGTLALALEYVDGLTLAGLLRALPPTPAADDGHRLRTALGGAQAAAIDDATQFFVRALRDVARAVQAVHEAGLLHLDIKPSNVLVRRDGHALLADFGIVREREACGAGLGFAGTPIYSAPEQLRGDLGPVGPAADVYALGMTLYELLARQQPLAGRPIEATLAELAAGRIPPLRSIAPWVPAELAAAVAAALQPDPRQRCPSAGAFADRLDQFLRDRDAAAGAAGANPRRPALARVAAALLALLVPLCAVLGVILYGELDRIRAQRWRETKARHAEVVHRVYQSLMTRSAVAPQRPDQLREVLAEDPHDQGALACLALLLSDPATPGNRGGLAGEPLLQRPGLGLSLLRQRVAQRRSYFVDAEVAALEASRDPVDMLLLVVDRLQLAKESLHPDSAKAAAAPLERLVLSQSHDPLPVSLRCWYAAETGDRRALQDASFALQQKWPDSEGCCVWQLFAWAKLDPKRGEELGREFLARHPDAFPAGVALAHCISVSDHARALDLLAKLPAKTPAEQLKLKQLRAHHLAALGKLDEARAACPPEELQDLRVLARLYPDTARAAFERLLADPAASHIDLVEALNAALTPGPLRSAELQLRLARHGHALYPDRAPFHWFLLEWYAAIGEFDKGAPLARQLRLPTANTDRIAWAAALCLGGARDWPAMADLCDRWLAAPTSAERHRALFYAGIAAARLQARERAYQLFEEHLAVGAASGRDGGQSQHYLQAYIERIALRLDPKSPPSLRSAAEHRRCQRELDTLELRQRGEPWWLLVMAEWQFRRGELAAARTSLERANANLRDERAFGVLARAIAPEDLETRIHTARQRLARIEFVVKFASLH